MGMIVIAPAVISVGCQIRAGLSAADERGESSAQDLKPLVFQLAASCESTI